MLEKHHGRIDALKVEDGELRIIGEDNPNVQTFALDPLGKSLLRDALEEL